MVQQLDNFLQTSRERLLHTLKKNKREVLVFSIRVALTALNS